MEERPEARGGAVPAPERAPRQRARWPWWLLGGLGGAALLLRVLLPLTLERGAAWASRRMLGLPVRIENVDLAVLAGHVVLDGLRVGSRPDAVTPWRAALDPPAIDPATALFQVDRIALELSWGALRERTLRVVALDVDAPSLRLEREPDGTIDPLRHAVSALPPDEEPALESPPDEEASAPWKIDLERFALHAPRVNVIDAVNGNGLLELALEELSLTDLVALGGGVALGGLDIEQPVLRVKRSLVVHDAAASPQETAVATAPASGAARAGGPAPDATPPAYTIERIDVDGAAFSWITDQGPLDVKLALHASGATLVQGRRFPVSLALEIGQGRIDLAGDVGLLPPAFAGKLEWADLPIPPLLLAGIPDVSAWLRSARSSGALSVALDTAATGADAGLRLSGRARVEQLAIADPEDREVSLGWRLLDLEIAELTVPIPVEGVDSGTPRVRLDRVALNAPKILYTLPSPQLDALLGAGAAPGAGADDAAVAPAPADAQAGPGAAAAGSAPPAPPLDLAIAALSVEGGDLAFLDRTVTPPVRTTIRDLDFSARDVRFPALQALDARLDAVLPKGAQLTVKGDLRGADQGDFRLALRDLPLPVFAPYAAGAGVGLEQGKASLDTKLRLRGAKLTLSNDLLLKQLAVSLRDPQSFEQQLGVPIDLALALLRDPAGNIRLAIPVALQEGGTAVALSGVLTSALRQALIGALSAPLKVVGVGVAGLAGSVAGGGLEGDAIPSPPGGPEPLPASRDRIAGLAQLLGERPGLAIALRGRAGAGDRPALARQLRDGGDLPPVAGEDDGVLARVGDFFSRLRPGGGRERDDAVSPAEVAAVPEERLRDLATRRAERLRALLVEQGADPARIRILEPTTDGEPGVAIELAFG